MAKHISDPSKQPELLRDDQAAYQETPEEQKAKESYRQRLRAYLHDPEFRKIEGFPLGEDEDILALSDPPYYTACPNPFLGEIIEKWQQERVELRKELALPDDSQDIGDGLKVYHREPFATDVSEGKNDPIYNAHSYHTKVPHKAIMRYILHYTDPGDIVLDGFCGTGMTGVAAQLCGDKKTVESMGYTVQRDGTIVDEKGEPISTLGARKAVLVDLSPAATFIAYNYNTPVDARAFEKEAHRILKEIEKECGWMYETWHPNCDDPNRVKGKINYTIWSDIFICPQCGSESIFWDTAIDKEKGTVRDAWDCPNCATRLAKSPQKNKGLLKVERAWETNYDPALGTTVKMAKQMPVLINYNVNGKHFNKRPDIADLGLIKNIETSDIPYPFPIVRMPEGDESRRNDDIGLTNVHHFYTYRNLHSLATSWAKFRQPKDSFIWLSGLLRDTTKLVGVDITKYFHGGGGPFSGGVKGTLYIPSVLVEKPVHISLLNRLNTLKRKMDDWVKISKQCVISTQDSSINLFSDTTIDYIFVDPPFGGNLMYSELNFLQESWFGVLTNNKSEAIVNEAQHKGLPEYQSLMEECFAKFFRTLKYGHWMTVEFHNSQNNIWNAIQEAILRVGFMIADVRTLDKLQGTFKQVTTTAAVKQDLIISAYKPLAEFEVRFLTEAGSVQGVWDFIRQHLEQLPIPALEKDVMETLAERQGYLLYDRMLVFHIMRGLAVPLSAAEFYQGLNQRYLERDSMYFTPGQAAEYDKRRLGAQKVEQLSLFVNDEKSAIQWLQRELDQVTGTGPQTYQDLQPKFLRELHQARYEALPELHVMLEDNFLQKLGGRWYVPDPEKQADLEALRQRSLLREFNEYLQNKGRLKVFRSEAVRAGFSHYWKERDYNTIMKVADRLPSNVLEEDQQLLMYVHNASLRQSHQPKQERLL